MSSTSHTPPRLLILATPAGSYLTLRLVPEHGWTEAAVLGALLFALVLWGPAGLRAATSAAVSKATAKKKESEATK